VFCFSDISGVKKWEKGRERTAGEIPKMTKIRITFHFTFEKSNKLKFGRRLIT
tara:strand:+ start:1062 stop:1220 length:159 start_codon:yes stop_codon:yes gene_type:complete